MALTRVELESKLWQAADILRGQIDAADYKNYIFSILFLKRLSDRFDEEVEHAVKDGVPRQVALTDRSEHEFFVPESARWPALVGATMNLGETLNIASHAIEEANTPRLDSVLAGTNWNDEQKLGSPANRERIIRSLLTHFSGLDLRDENLREDAAGGGNVLGDAYEYLINQFADDAGKKGGEFYTPRSVVRLIVELLQPKEGMRICDPTAGSGGMLIYAAQYVREHGGRPPQPGAPRPGAQPGHPGHRQAQPTPPRPASRTPGARRRHRRTGPQWTSSGRLLSYDRVIANPPFSLKNWGHDFAPNDPHHRFDRYGATPPRTRGDLAFLLHMLAVTNSQGMVGVVMPHGVLFPGRRGGERYASGIVEADLFEAVIGLAPNLFSGASIPVAICVLNRAKPAERRGRVLFVDAAQEGGFRPGKARNYLDPEHIARIVAGVQRLRGRGPLRPRRQPGGDTRERLQPEHQPLRGHHRARGGDERGRRSSPAAGGGAAAGRGRGGDGQAPGRDGICQRLGTRCSSFSVTAGGWSGPEAVIECTNTRISTELLWSQDIRAMMWARVLGRIY